MVNGMSLKREEDAVREDSVNYIEKKTDNDCFTLFKFYFMHGMRHC